MYMKRGKHSRFVKEALFTASVIALVSGVNAAYAQDASTDAGADEEEAETLDEIIVTGARSSIKRALDLKKNADNIIDAIVAEDIGKFPDENLADALQRVAGITITRNNGEGQRITVRGLGEGYNVTTFNGRRVASEAAGRVFNYDMIASELVGGIEVYKSPQANITEGGIGAVVNVKTRRPLDIGEFALAGSAKGIYESRTKDIHPSGSLLISNVFGDGKFGALLAATYSKKTLREDSYSGGGFYDPDAGNGWLTVPFDADGNGTINNDLDGSGEIDGGESANAGEGSEYFPSKIPGYMYYTNSQDTRERKGLNVALQWRPTDNLDINFDGIYSEYDTNGSTFQIGFVTYDEWWTPGIPHLEQANFGDDGRINSMVVGNSPVVELLNLTNPRKSTTYQGGFNIEWTNDTLTLALDLSHSKAENKNGGDNRFVVARGVVDSYSIDHSKGNILPDVVLNPALDENQPYGAHYSLSSGDNIVDKVSEIQFDGKWEPDGDYLKSVEFGVGYGVQSKDKRSHRTPNPSTFSNGGQYLTRDGYAFDASLAESFGPLTLFRIPSDAFVAPNFDNFLAGEEGVAPAPWPSFDYDKLFSYYETINKDAANNGIKAAVRPDQSYEIEEKLLNAYLRAKIENQVAGMDYMLDLGLRFVETKVASSGVLRDASQVEFDENGDLVDKDYNAFIPVTAEGNYSNILPSLNFKLNITDDVIWRVAAAKVISRPELWRMTPYEYFSIQDRKIFRSNPDLDPFKANQLDFALEWYFSDYGAVSVAVYLKDIESFVSDQRFDQTVSGIEWEVNQPQSSEYGASIKGIEISYQQTFDEYLPEFLHGLGVQANYAYTDSKFDDPDYSGLPFTGMSKHSYNLVGYYEKDRVQARVAYSWQGKSVSDPNAWGGANWIAPYGQLDISASYKATEQITVFAEASNLTNARYHQYVEREDQISYLSHFGRQISLGARFAF